MNHKSKLIQNLAQPLGWTSIVVLVTFLFAFLPLGAFADAGVDHEIGVPQAKGSPANGCFGVALSPDGNRFYTVREGLLTQYRTTPFEKISSVKLAREHIKDRPEEPCRVFITDGESQLIIAFHNRVLLIDARLGTLLNKFELELSPIQSAEINGDDLVTIEKKYTGYDEYYYSLVIRDAESLEIKREVKDLGKNYGFYPDTAEPRLVKVQNRIYLTLHKKFLVLNGKTYAPELFVQSNAIIVAGPFLSTDYQTISFPQGSKVVDYLTARQEIFEGVKEDDVLAFNQATRISEFKKRPNVNSPKRWYGIPIINIGQVSLSKEEIIASPPFRGNSSFSLINATSRKWRRFLQYENGEAIMLDPADGNFQLTGGAKKYLMMKNRSGNIVPINDATFAKYHMIGRSSH